MSRVFFANFSAADASQVQDEIIVTASRAASRVVVNISFWLFLAGAVLFLGYVRDGRGVSNRILPILVILAFFNFEKDFGAFSIGTYMVSLPEVIIFSLLPILGYYADLRQLFVCRFIIYATFLSLNIGAVFVMGQFMHVISISTSQSLSIATSLILCEVIARLVHHFSCSVDMKASQQLP